MLILASDIPHDLTSCDVRIKITKPLPYECTGILPYIRGCATWPPPYKRTRSLCEYPVNAIIKLKYNRNVFLETN